LKQAFTIIEIIFIIVIISILALTAIPRLSATYDDAKVAVALNSISTLINDLSTYYTANEKYNSNIKYMTDVQNVSYSTLWDSISQSGILTYYTLDNNSNLEPCVLFSIRNEEGNLTISNISAPSGQICKTVQTIHTYKQLLGTRLIGSNRIKF
jgi:type II secretory pathway pseudopilin PulG